MTSTPPPKKRPPAPRVEDDGAKTVKLSATELRQQLQDLGVDLDAVDGDKSSDERARQDRTGPKDD
jgi:hypothetical protein